MIEFFKDTKQKQSTTFSFLKFLNHASLCNKDIKLEIIIFKCNNQSNKKQNVLFECDAGLFTNTSLGKPALQNTQRKPHSQQSVTFLLSVCFSFFIVVSPPHPSFSVTGRSVFPLRNFALFHPIQQCSRDPCFHPFIPIPCCTLPTVNTHATSVVVDNSTLLPYNLALILFFCWSSPLDTTSHNATFFSV